MSLNFPLTMPTEGIADQDFKIARVDYASPEVGGRTGAVQAGFPRWRLTLSLGAMSREAGDAWRAFLDSLNGSARTFYACDVLRPYPAAYPGGLAGMTKAGGGAFPSDGKATSWSVNSTRDELTLGGLPAFFQFKVGDLVGFRWNTDRRTIVRVMASANASSGGAVTLAIRPGLPNLVPSNAEAYLASPTVVMRISTGETTIGPEDTISTAGGTIVAGQDLT